MYSFILRSVGQISLIIEVLTVTFFKRFQNKIFIILQQGIPTLQNCWDQGKNVIVSYDYPANYHPEMWKKITYYYANSMDRAQVKSKISEALGKEKTSNCEFSQLRHVISYRQQDIHLW